MEDAERADRDTCRIDEWSLIPVSCALCGNDLGYAENPVKIWCDYCAKQPEKAEDLK